MQPPRVEPPPDHTPWELTFLPRPGHAASSVGDIAALLRERSIVGAVAEGAALGRPDAVGAVLATDETGRTLLDVSGRLAPGQPIQELIAGLAYLTGCRIIVDEHVVVRPDGTEEEPTEQDCAIPRTRSAMLWRATEESAAHVRMAAFAAHVPIAHTTLHGWTVIAAPEGRLLDPDVLALDRRERPLVTVARIGATRVIRWQHRQRLRSVDVIVTESAWPGSVVCEAGPETAAGRLAVALGSFSVRDVPRTRLLGEEVRAELSRIPAGSGDTLAAACRLLDVPLELVHAMEGAVADESVHWFQLPGTVVIHPDRSVPDLIRAGIRDVLLSAVSGTGWRGSMRRWFWRRPRTLNAIAVGEIALGGLLGAWATSGGALFGQRWALWLLAAVWVADGALNLAAGRVAAQRRRASTGR